MSSPSEEETTSSNAQNVENEIVIPIEPTKRIYNRDQILKYRPKANVGDAPIALNIETFSARKRNSNSRSPVSPGADDDQNAGQWTRVSHGRRYSPHSPTDDGNRKPKSPFSGSKSPKSPTSEQFLGIDRFTKQTPMSPSEELYNFQKTIRGFLSQLNFKSLEKTTEEVMNFLQVLSSEKNTASSFSPVAKGSNYLLLLVQEICIEVFPKPQKAALFAAFCQTYHKKESEITSQQNFRRELLNYMNSEFTKYESQSSKSVTKSLGEDLDKEEMTGFVTFIGELFKAQLLSSKVVIDIVLRSLLKKVTDKKAISSAIKLLLIVGPELEPSKKKNEEIEGFFDTLKEISQRKQTDPKLKSKIEDLIEIRKNEWKSASNKEL